MKSSEVIQQELQTFVDEKKAAFFPRFFKTQKGDYGEGDQFIGITVPHMRKVAKSSFKEVELSEVEKLLQHPIHEYRLTALLILVYQFEKAKEEESQQAVVDLYLNNLAFVNNWDLVDSSAEKILGRYLFTKPKTLLYQFAEANNLWKQRIAIISTYHFIKQKHFEDTLAIAKMLLHHKHDLIHKAVGWMLREVGNRNFETAYNFLKEHYKTMPRTMLRYAIEKFDPKLRLQLLKGTI